MKYKATSKLCEGAAVIGETKESAIDKFLYLCNFIYGQGLIRSDVDVEEIE